MKVYFLVIKEKYLSVLIVNGKIKYQILNLNVKYVVKNFKVKLKYILNLKINQKKFV